MKIGKVDEALFRSLIRGKFGRRDPSVLVPPMAGVDAGVIDLGGGRVLVVAEDPIFTMPRLPLETFGRFTVRIGASDVAVMGGTRTLGSRRPNFPITRERKSDSSILPIFMTVPRRLRAPGRPCARPLRWCSSLTS